MSRPTIERNGDDIGLAWEDQGVMMLFELLRETGYGLKGEITVEIIGAGHLIWSGLNLSSTSERGTLARQLKGKAGNIDWFQLLDQACVIVSREYRMGDAVVNLATVPEGNGIKTLVPRFFMPDYETSTIFADGGSMKSYLALYISLCVATGQPFPWGGRPARTGNVLYFDYETTAQEQADRLRLLCRGLGIDIPTNIHYRRQVRPVPADIAQMKREADKLEIVLAVIDSLGAACGGDAKEQSVVQPTYQAVRGMKDAARLVLTHMSKSGADGNGRATPFGSAYVTNESRSVWELKRSEDASDDQTVSVGCYHFKVNNSAKQKPIGLRFDWDAEAKTCLVRQGDLMDADDLAAKTPLSFRLRNALRGGAKTVPELAEEVSAKEHSIYVTLKRMSDAIQLDPGGGGRGKQTRWGLRAFENDEPPF